MPALSEIYWPESTPSESLAIEAQQCGISTLWLLTQWGRVTHICISKLTIIGSDNGSSPVQRQAIIWTNAGILLIGTLGTNFNEILIKIYIFSLKKMHFNLSSGNWRSFCLGLIAPIGLSFWYPFINSLWPSDTIWRHIWVNIGSGNGLLPDGTKPLPEPMLTFHNLSPVTFILGQFHKRCLNHQPLKSVKKNYISKILLKFPRGQWVKTTHCILLADPAPPDFITGTDQQTSYSDLTKWQGTRLSVPAMATRCHAPLNHVYNPASLTQWQQ